RAHRLLQRLLQGRGGGSRAGDRASAGHLRRGQRRLPPRDREGGRTRRGRPREPAPLLVRRAAMTELLSQRVPSTLSSPTAESAGSSTASGRADQLASIVRASAVLLPGAAV